jgi:glutathione S-transferase
MIDAAFDAVIEKRRPAGGQWTEWIARQQRAVERGLSVAAAMPCPPDRFDLGDVSLVCLLGYLDFRHPAIAWRTTYPDLARWFDMTSRRPSIAETHPELAIA